VTARGEQGRGESRYMTYAAHEPTRINDHIASVGLFVLHTLVAMVICTFLLVMAALVANPLLHNSPSWLRSAVDYGGVLNPVVWIPAIALGFFANRLIKEGPFRRVACWVWVVGIVWLSLAIWDSVRHADLRYYQDCSVVQSTVNSFFTLDSTRCQGGESTLAGLFFTIPAINSIGYAIGAAIALPSSKKR